MSSYFGGLQKRRDDSTIRLALLVCVTLFFVASCALILIVSSSGSDTISKPAVIVEKNPGIEMVEVLVPVQSIEAGAALEPAMFRIESQPKVNISDKVLRDFEQIKGLYARTLILANQPLHGEFITNSKPVNTITAMIPEGYRAVTIKVDERSGIEGWARPGAKVDVSWSSNLRGKQAVTIIVQNARVISAAKHVESDNPLDGTVPPELTLLVPTEDANKILLAQQSGSLSLSLRGDRESGKGTFSSTLTVDDLLGPPIDPKKPKPENVIRVRSNDGEYQEFVLRDGKLIPVMEAINAPIAAPSNG